ncbi:E3 ubiquitin-protein ligase HRD1 [Zancudomyces culisetae]|uniref:E3 ubiquitin-protein ligase HRD1 n=1 Tax=Zancudomyces culisetae TaxID=1213189 RepID=A0A1R1PK19_ZANCU|nr:E3 ubiquitin-protein ligase HRD1 [Zancudomyces culisetae]|eukprot:OMH81311.1 E3 ubiquitin-protein ligase HRD1 [Zancudomyces culisetae]
MKLTSIAKYNIAIKNLNTLYPDLTADEINGLRDKVCIICREDVQEPDRVKKLNCGHYFHYNCLKNWLSRQQSCPTCRRSVFEKPHATVSETVNLAHDNSPNAATSSSTAGATGATPATAAAAVNESGIGVGVGATAASGGTSHIGDMAASIPNLSPTFNIGIGYNGGIIQHGTSESGKTILGYKFKDPQLIPVSSSASINGLSNTLSSLQPGSTDSLTRQVIAERIDALTKVQSQINECIEILKTSLDADEVVNKN